MPSHRELVSSLLVAAAVLIGLAVLWTLRDVLLLAFASIILAVVARSLAETLRERARVPQRAALPLSGLMMLSVLVVLLWLLQRHVFVQFALLAEEVPAALPKLGELLGMPGLADALLEAGRQAVSAEGAFGRLASFGIGVTGVIADVALVVFGAAYLAADPRLYTTGLVKLFPPRLHGNVRETLVTLGNALRLWLIAQAVSMTVTGVLTGAALWIIGVPSPLALGLIAAAAEIVPLVGPFLAAVPALLLALSVSAETTFWTAAAFLVIQQAESNLVQPLVTRVAVKVPPALLLFAVVAFGILFGVAGVLLAAPLTVSAFVVVNKLYVRETLGEYATVPGEPPPGP